MKSFVEKLVITHHLEHSSHNNKDGQGVCMRDFDGVEIATLENGFTVITDHLLDNPRTATNLIMASGGFHDPIGQSGISHLLEHMMAHSHPNHDNRDFSDMRNRLAMPSGLSTEVDRVYAHAFGRTSSVMEYMNWSGCMMSAMGYTRENLEDERGPIWQEMNAAHADINTLHHIERMGSIFGYENPITRNFGGHPDELRTISYEDLKAFEAEHFVGNNMYFVSSGGLSHADAVSFSQTYFGHLQPGKRQSRFGAPLNLQDVHLPTPTAQNQCTTMRLRFDASALMPVNEAELGFVAEFLNRVLMHGLRFDDQSVYSAQAKFSQANEKQLLLEVETAFHPNGMDAILKRLNRIFESIRLGSDDFEGAYTNAREKMSNAYAEHALNIMDDLATRRNVISTNFVDHGRLPNPSADINAMHALAYSDILRVVAKAVEYAPVVEHHGHVGEYPLTGAQIGQELSCAVSTVDCSGRYVVGRRAVAYPQVT